MEEYQIWQFNTPFRLIKDTGGNYTLHTVYGIFVCSVTKEQADDILKVHKYLQQKIFEEDMTRRENSY